MSYLWEGSRPIAEAQRVCWLERAQRILCEVLLHQRSELLQLIETAEFTVNDDPLPTHNHNVWLAGRMPKQLHNALVELIWAHDSSFQK